MPHSFIIGNTNDKVGQSFRESSGMEKIQRILAGSVFLFLFWVFLSGKLDLFHLSVGLIGSIAIASLSLRDEEKYSPFYWIRLPLYIPWLLWRVFAANLHTAYLILHPRLPIDPKIIRYNSKLNTNAAKVLLANSITLTPGTITVDIEGNEFVIHSLDDASTLDLKSGLMEKNAGWVFRDGEL